MSIGLYQPAARIPTWIALLSLVLMIGVTVTGLQIFTGRPFARANSGIQPQQVEITNLTPTSFTVSWLTAASTPGYVRYGANQQPQLVARDSRDHITGEPGNYQTHWVTINGLSPQTSYAFSIYSGTQIFNNNLAPYAVTTAPESAPNTLSSDTKPIQGVILTSSNQPASNALVYLRAPDLSPLSTIADSDGNWTFNLSIARTANLSAPFGFSEATILEASIQGNDFSSQSSVVFPLSHAHPLPAVILGQDYNFLSL